MCTIRHARDPVAGGRRVLVARGAAARAIAGGQPAGSGAGQGSRQQRQQHAAAQQRSRCGSEIRSGRAAVHERPGPRDQRPDPAARTDVARAARPARDGWAASCSRAALVGPRAFLPVARPITATRRRRAAASSSASPSIERGRALDCVAITFTTLARHRPHPHVRQDGAAAADRLHAVLVARDAVQEPAQLRRPGPGRACCRS